MTDSLLLSRKQQAGQTDFSTVERRDLHGNSNPQTLLTSLQEAVFNSSEVLRPGVVVNSACNPVTWAAVMVASFEGFLG
ncbi:UNVERIFIED_CONTAM: hypothetical protein K2H54_045596 [Gekko kuhli]